MPNRLEARVAPWALTSLGIFLWGAPVAAQAAGGTDDATGYAVVLAARLNVRGAPSLDAQVLATVARGDTLCVVSVRDDWAEVFAPTDGAPGETLQGYVARGFLAERRGPQSALAEVGCTGLRLWEARLPFKARSQSSRPPHTGAALFHVRKGVRALRAWAVSGATTVGYRSGQTGQTVNLLAQPSEVRILPPPLQETLVSGRARRKSEAGVAQLARASAFQAEGRGFESRLPL